MVKVSQVNSNFIDLDVNVDVEVLIELYSTPDISKAGEKKQHPQCILLWTKINR